MTPEYEALFSDVLSELVAASVEYADGTASDVYIYASTEGGSPAFEPFFGRGDELVERHKLPGIDTSSERQRALLRYGNDQLIRLIAASPQPNQPLPTEMKLHYKVSTGETDARVRYDPIWLDSEGASFEDVSEQWKAEIQDGFSATV